GLCTVAGPGDARQRSRRPHFETYWHTRKDLAMRKLLSYAAAASLTVSGMGLLGCDHNKSDRDNSMRSDSGAWNDSARTSGYGTSGNNTAGGMNNSSTPY